MATGSERKREDKSAFTAVALASGFLHEAEKYGLTPELLQRLRESPKRMQEFVAVAKLAQEDHDKMLARRRYEEECAIDIDGVHYHLVLVRPEDLGCSLEETFGEVVRCATRYNYIQLDERAYAQALRVVSTMKHPGLWFAGKGSTGDIRAWKSGPDTVKTLQLRVSNESMLARFGLALRGFVFMSKFIGCDFAPQG